MTDTPHGPTTEELRARALQANDAPAAAAARQGSFGWLEAARSAALLPRPCLACNREQGERMCDLCQRLELAEAAAP